MKTLTGYKAQNHHNPAAIMSGKKLVSSENFNTLLDSIGPGVERKTRSQLDSGVDIHKALEHIEQAMDFSTKLLLSNAKNMGMPGDEDNSSKSREMSEIATSIANMMATKALINAQMAQIEAHKNPPIDLMQAKGKLIEYSEKSKLFSGKPITYNYQISHNETEAAKNINAILYIKNAAGETVKTIHQNIEAGKHQYMWQGLDENGQKVEPGIYSLEISAKGSKKINGKDIKFTANAFVGGSGIADQVKIEKGIATGLIVNGRLVQREQINSIKDQDNASARVDNILTADLIGKQVTLDLTTAVVENGELIAYFDNELKTNSKQVVKVFDQQGKYLKTLTNEQPVGVGVGKLTFNATQTQLADGQYNISFAIEDISDKANPKMVAAKTEMQVRVIGIDQHRKNILSLDKHEFKAANIKNIIGDFVSPIEQRRQEYLGAKILYRDDFFEYQPAMAAVNFPFNLPEEDGILLKANMSIYDASTNELVDSVASMYEPYNELTADSKVNVVPYMQANFATSNYNLLNSAEKQQLTQHIAQELAGGNLTLQTNVQEKYKQGKINLNFASWDGKFSDGGAAEIGHTYRREFTPIYLRPDGSTYAGATDRELVIANVESVEETMGQLKLNLFGGITIPEERVLEVKKPTGI